MNGMKPPSTWGWLPDPARKGKLIFPDPVKTGGGYIFIATQVFRFAAATDWQQSPAAASTMAATIAWMAATAQATMVDYTKAIDAAMDYMKKLNVNVGQYAGTSPQAIQLVGQGQFVGAPNWSHDILTAKTQGNPVDLVVPSDSFREHVPHLYHLAANARSSSIWLIRLTAIRSAPGAEPLLPT